MEDLQRINGLLWTARGQRRLHQKRDRRFPIQCLLCLVFLGMFKSNPTPQKPEVKSRNGRLLPDLRMPPGGSHASLDCRRPVESSSRWRNARSVEARRDFRTHEFEEHANAPSVVEMH
jgi:hypothetical protein